MQFQSVQVVFFFDLFLWEDFDLHFILANTITGARLPDGLNADF